MKRLYSARDGAEAHFLRTLLEAESVHVSVQGEAMEAVRGAVPPTMGSLPALWVDEADWPRAREILASLMERGGGPRSVADRGGVWRCHRCGEIHEPQFTECWNCGDARGADPPAPIPVIPLQGNSLDYAGRDSDDALANDLMDEPPAEFLAMTTVIAVPDLQKASDFYRHVLDFEVEPSDAADAEEHLCLRRGQARLTFCSGPLSTGVGLHIVADDLEDVLDQCVRRGADIVESPRALEGPARTFALRDPNGLIVRFVQSLDS